MALLAAQTETAGMAEEETSDFDFLMGQIRLWFPAVFSLAVMYYTYININITPPGFLLFWGVLFVGTSYYGVRKIADNPFLPMWFLPAVSALVTAVLFISINVKTWEVGFVALLTVVSGVAAFLRTRKIQRRS